MTEISIAFQYKPLFEVIFHHEYFKDGLLHHFEVIPDEGTVRMCSQNNMLFKRTDNGFVILINYLDYDKLVFQFERIKNEMFKLNFWLVVKGGSFVNYSNINSDSINKLFLLSNKSLKAKTEGMLHVGKHVSFKEQLEDKDIEGVEQPVNVKGKVVALIQLELNSTIVDDILSKLIDKQCSQFKYMVSFEARRTTWRYLIYSDNDRKLKALSINSKSNEVMFTLASVQEINSKRLLIFEAKQEISFKQRYNYEFQLIRGKGDSAANVIKKRLQFADPDNLIPKSSGDNTKYYSDIHIYI